MNPRKEIFIINKHVSNLKDVDVDLIDLKREVLRFYADMMLRNKGILPSIIRLLNARTHLNNAIIISKSYFEPEKNIYISELEKEFKSVTSFNNYLGISNAILDVMQDELVSKTESKILEFHTLELRIEKHKQLMQQYMQDLIIYSYRNALIKIIKFNPQPDKDNKIPVKDFDLFTYFLFLEFYHASEVLGALSRQLVLEKKLGGLKLDTESGRIPPELPSNMRYENYNEQNQVQEFKDPFEDLGEEYV